MNAQPIRVQDLVQAGLYENEEEVMQEALRHFLRDRPDLRIAVAVHRYRTDQELSLARAAAIAGVSLERMKEILERQSVPLRLGPASMEQARAEKTALEKWLNTDTD